MMHSPYRDTPASSVADLQDYYDVIPVRTKAQTDPGSFTAPPSFPQPAHHLASYGNPQDPYSFTQDIPLTNTARSMQEHSGRGTYVSPIAAQNAAADRFVYPRNQWAEKSNKSNRRAKWIVSSCPYTGDAYILLLLQALWCNSSCYWVHCRRRLSGHRDLEERQQPEFGFKLGLRFWIRLEFGSTSSQPDESQ
jgi:hypothetical protein